MLLKASIGYKLVLLLFFINGELTSQTSEEFYDSIKTKIKVKKEYKPLMIKTTDNRFVKDHQLEISIFIKKLIDKLESDGYEIENTNKSKLKVTPVEFHLVVDYLNLYQNASKNLFAKGIISLKLVDSNINFMEDEISISEDIPIQDMTLKEIYKQENISQLENAKEVVLNNLVENIITKSSTFLKRSNTQIKKVICFGKSPIRDSIKEARKSAVYQALTSGCSMAWGVKIENVTTLIDFAEVEDTTTGLASGLVTEYKVIEEFVSSDNYYSVLVEAILLKNSNNKN